MATTIGEQLQLAREEQGIALREISNQTRISMRYLEAIETNDYKRLPGGIFNRSFVKAYAKCVGFDERQALEGYARLMRELGQPYDDVDTTPHHPKVYDDQPATRSPVLTVFLAILILAILTLGALAAFHWYQRRASSVSDDQRQLSLFLSHSHPVLTGQKADATGWPRGISRWFQWERQHETPRGQPVASLLSLGSVRFW